MSKSITIPESIHQRINILFGVIAGIIVVGATIGLCKCELSMPY